MEIHINRLLIDPATISSGEMQLLSLGSVEVKSLEVSQDDLRDLIKFYAPELENMSVEFKDGLIKLNAKYDKFPIEIAFKLYNPNPGSDNSDIFFELKKIKVGFFPIPAGLVNFMVKDFNPLLNKTNAPVKLKFNQIVVKDGKLLVM